MCSNLNIEDVFRNITIDQGKGVPAAACAAYGAYVLYDFTQCQAINRVNSIMWRFGLGKDVIPPAMEEALARYYHANQAQLTAAKTDCATALAGGDAITDFGCGARCDTHLNYIEEVDTSSHDDLWKGE